MTKLQQVREFIAGTIKDTLKEPNGLLKYQYITPGGVYATDLWDWDSYWTLYAMFGLAKVMKKPAIAKQITPYARGTFFNFLDHQGPDGAIPILIMPKDEDPFDCLKDPDNNMAKPFIAQLGKLLLDNKILQPEDLYERIYKLRAFHQCYEKRYLDAKTGLVFWAKDWGIGVDDDPAAWGRPLKSCGSMYLNVFLYRDYLAAEELSDLAGRSDYAEEYRRKANALAESIRKYCWDPREKAYFSVDLQCHTNISQHRLWGALNIKLDAFWNCLRIKVLSWNSVLPLWAGIGTKEQMADFVREHLTADRLMGKYGVRSLSADEPMYAPEVARGNPSNWLGPIWLIANYITWDALVKYGFRKEADKLANTIINLLSSDLEKCGKFHEYYSPETGRGITSPGFMSWNSLAGLMSAERR